MKSIPITTAIIGAITTLAAPVPQTAPLHPTNCSAHEASTLSVCTVRTIELAINKWSLNTLHKNQLTWSQSTRDENAAIEREIQEWGISTEDLNAVDARQVLVDTLSKGLPYWKGNQYLKAARRAYKSRPSPGAIARPHPNPAKIDCSASEPGTRYICEYQLNSLADEKLDVQSDDALSEKAFKQRIADIMRATENWGFSEKELEAVEAEIESIDWLDIFGSSPMDPIKYSSKSEEEEANKEKETEANLECWLPITDPNTHLPPPSQKDCFSSSYPPRAEPPSP